MKRKHPVGFPEAAILYAMPYRKPMTVREIQVAAHARVYSGVRAILEALEQAGWVESVLRKPRTGRTALAWKRIAALPVGWSNGKDHVRDAERRIAGLWSLVRPDLRVPGELHEDRRSLHEKRVGGRSCRVHGPAFLLQHVVYRIHPGILCRTFGECQEGKGVGHARER